MHNILIRHNVTLDQLQRIRFTVTINDSVIQKDGLFEIQTTLYSHILSITGNATISQYDMKVDYIEPESLWVSLEIAILVVFGVLLMLLAGWIYYKPDIWRQQNLVFFVFLGLASVCFLVEVMLISIVPTQGLCTARWVLMGFEATFVST
jgi:hypothetical protein